MRETNFVNRRKPPVKSISMLVWLCVAGTLAATAWQGTQAVTMSRDLERLQARVAAQVQPDDVQDNASAPAPTRAALAELAARVAFYNEISGTRSVSPGILLFALEEAVPPSAWIQTIAYDQGNGTLKMTLLSEDEAVLPETLRKIEDIDWLSGVVLERQIRVRQGQKIVSQYDVSASVS